MKKFIGVLILLSIAMFPVNAAFSDVRTDHVYKTAIDYVQAQGIVSGYSDGKFRPGNSITRGEFTKIIINSVYSAEEISQMSASLYAPACETCQGFGVVKIFNDLVSTSEWARYAFVAKQNGIVSGYSDGTFKPNNYITAGQASKIIANAFKMVNQSNLQVDPNDKFKPYIQALVNRRAIPQEVKSRESYLTRGEMAEIIYRVKNYVIDKPYTELSNILTNAG